MSIDLSVTHIFNKKYKFVSKRNITFLDTAHQTQTKYFVKVDVNKDDYSNFIHGRRKIHLRVHSEKKSPNQFIAFYFYAYITIIK